MKHAEILTADRRQCQQRLKEIETTYNLIEPLTSLNYDSIIIDDIVNEILYLEDRIQQLDLIESIQSGISTKNRNLARVFPGIMTPRGRADNIVEAAKLMGYSPVTIHTYLITKRDLYYRCE